MSRGKYIIFLTLCGSVSLLMGFKPFARVNNVCPSCPSSMDSVVLEDIVIQCNVVAHNADYLIIERYGEYRALSKAEVVSIQWKEGQERQLEVGDQVVLKNGVVFHGSIAHEQRDYYFIIQMGNLQHVVWHGLIEAVYKNGVRYDR